MERTLTCDCGFEAHAADDDGLVAEIKRHASETHGMQLSDDEARALASAAANRASRKEEQ